MRCPKLDLFTFVLAWPLPLYLGNPPHTAICTNWIYSITKRVNGLSFGLRVDLSPPNKNLAADCSHEAPKWLGVDYACLFRKMAKPHEMHKVDLFHN